MPHTARKIEEHKGPKYNSNETTQILGNMLLMEQHLANKCQICTEWLSIS
uniref:Uncharacterized protein n=1 Tax=Arundo donax TaxID=35708 RepID=A0A0A9HPW2_ARUDO